MKLGIEQEFFVLSNTEGRFVNALKISHDSCGWLAEARGGPANSVTDAVGLLWGATRRLEVEAAALNLTLDQSATASLSRKFLAETIREVGTKQIHSDLKSIYGKPVRIYPRPTAGIHLNFGERQSVSYIGYSNSGAPIVQSHTTVDTVADFMPQLIHALDKVFEECINKARRQSGIYRIKSFGFEYRSLPTNISNQELADGIATALKIVTNTELEP